MSNNYRLGIFVWDPEIGSYIIQDSFPVDISDEEFDSLPDLLSDFDITDLLSFDDEI